MAHRDENDRLMDGDLPLNPFDGAEPVQSPAPKAPLGPLNLGSMFPTARQLEMTGATKTPWLVQDVLLRGGVTYLYGDPKAGKSTVTMAMLLDVAAGVSALLTYAVVEGRALRVLVFSEQPDGSNVDLERVFDPPRQDGRPRHGANVRYLKREASGTLDDLDQVLYLARHAGQHHEADVIVFDR